MQTESGYARRRRLGNVSIEGLLSGRRGVSRENAAIVSDGLSRAEYLKRPGSSEIAAAFSHWDRLIHQQRVELRWEDQYVRFHSQISAFAGRKSLLQYLK